jgi:hypothetical protein
MKHHRSLLAFAVAVALVVLSGCRKDDCLAGSTRCGSTCVNLSSDQLNCGACGNGCDPGMVCSLGACAASCAVGLEDCSGACSDLSIDPAHCGGCATPCDAGDVCWGGACQGYCLTVAGPALTSGGSGKYNTGLQLTALRDTVLTGFTFLNEGRGDTITLWAGSSELRTLTVPWSTPTFTASVDWPLTAGVTYRLVSLEAGNGLWANYSSFPVGASLRVNGGNWGDTIQMGTWYGFVNLTTCP